MVTSWRLSERIVVPVTAALGGAAAVVACVGDDPAPLSVVVADAGQNAPDGGIISGTVDSGSDAAADVDAGPPPAKGTLVWLTSATTAATDIAIDAAGNVAAVGSYVSNTPLDFGNGKGVPASPAGAGFVAKFDNTGKCLWAVQINAPGGGIFPQLTGVAIDPSNGDVVFSAIPPAAISIGSGTPKGGFGGFDIAIGKLSANGTEKYLKVFGGPDGEAAFDLAIDGSGRVVFTGYIVNSGPTNTSFDGIDAVGPQKSEAEAVVVALDASGVAQWVKVFPNMTNNAGQSQGNSVALDGDGNVLVGGEFKSSMQWNYPSITMKSLTAAAYVTGFVAKVDGVTGTAGWAVPIGGSGGASVKYIGADPGRNVVAAFEYTDVFTMGTRNLTSFGQQDIAYARFDPGSTLLDVHEFGSTGSDYVHGLAIDAWGEVIFAGSESATINFGLPATANGAGAGFLTKFDAKANALWAYGIGGATGGNVSAAAVNAGGRIAFSAAVQGNATVVTQNISFDAGVGVYAVVEP